ncbi:MAG TPA: ABC transporter permease, partial [Ignavibacteriaceae bacterium]|nr:ABC transporter permease [Ignavibacteriaceae bacterium]
MKVISKIIIKEFLQLKRDPRLFRIVIIAPVIQLILLGYAANLDINNIKTMVYDLDKTSASRDFIEKFQSSGYFSINSYAENYEQVADKINKGADLWALIIPKDFEKKLKRGEQVKIQAIFDGSDGNKAGIAFGYVTGLVSSYSQGILAETKDKSGSKISFISSITPELRVWYNPDLKTRFFILPGLMGLILTIITTTLMAMGIVKEREIGTYEQIIVTPIK